MILGVDASRATGQRTGVGRVVEYLLRSWSRQTLPFDQVRVFSPAPITDLPKDGPLVPEVIPARGAGLWWEAAHLRRRARRVDAFFAPYTLPPALRAPSVVYNLGIYEGPYAFPGWRARARSWHQAYSARRADRVLAICPTTKSDLVRYYGIAPGKISVAWPGLDPRFRPLREEEKDRAAAAVADLLGDDAPYLLFVGKLSLRRNVPSLLDAFARVARSHRDLRLVLVGPNTADVPVERMLAELGVRDSVRYVNHLDHATLTVLYRGARAFVMPTESEGFSITILEAMASGCPVLTLKGALLGVLEYLEGPRDFAAGGPVLEADDARPESLAPALERLAVDDDFCVELGHRGRRFAASFPSWDDTAGEFMDVLAEVAGAGPARAGDGDARGAVS